MATPVTATQSSTYWIASDFEIAVLAANRIDRKNEIDAVPAISPWIGLGDYS